MVNILLVSHSHELAKATHDFAKEMKQADFKFEFVGGIDGGKSFGSDSIEISNKIKELTTDRELVVLYDLGSSLLNTQLALQLINDEKITNKVTTVNCAFVEGTIIAVSSNVENTTGKELKEIIEQQCQIQK